jgi:motility quorum-sensing regulator/GCU-specific mRNA interferase toxin
VTDKKKPTYDLDAFKDAFSSVEKLNITRVATRTASDLGFNLQDIVDVLQTMQRVHFYKSMTSDANYTVWQDVYHVPSDVGLLYVKFTANSITLFQLLSFKEKDDG